MGLPVISILMSVYNSEKFLLKTIESIRSQDFKDWELICVNDGSTDSSIDILNEFASNDQRISVYSIQNSGCASIPRNIGLTKSKGNYVLQHDSDDFCSPNLLSNLYKRVIDTNADCVLPDLEFYYPNEILKNHSIVGKFGDRNVVLSGREALLLSLNWDIHGLGLFNGNLLRAIKYDVEGMNGDEFTTRKLFSLCNSVTFSEGTYFYVQHPSSITKKITPKLFDVYHTNVKILNLLIENTFETIVVHEFCLDKYRELFYGLLRFLNMKDQFSKDEKSLILQKISSPYKAMDKKLCFQSVVHSSVSPVWKILLLSTMVHFRIFCVLAYCHYVVQQFRKLNE